MIQALRSATLDSRAAWAIATAALVILTIANGAPLLAAIALKPIAAELGTTRAAVSAAGSFVYIGAAAGGILAGWLTGWIAFRWIVLFGAAMIAAGLTISAMGGIWTIYVGHGVLVGLFGTACMFSPLMTYVSRWFLRRRGSAIALISSGQSLAGAIWPLIFDAGIRAYGWRTTMIAFGLCAAFAIALLAFVFLVPPPATERLAGDVTRPADGQTRMTGLSPNVLMVLLMVAVFSCCVPMAVPMQHLVAFCGDLGFGAATGPAMLSVLLGSAFLSRMFWGGLADRIGGLWTLLWSSLAQITTLSGFLLTRNETALFAISAAFGLGFSGLLPAYVVVIREKYPPQEANWRVPTVLFAGFLGMAMGGWGAGLIYDLFGYYMVAFTIGVAFNGLNVAVLLFLLARIGQPARREVFA